MHINNIYRTSTDYGRLVWRCGPKDISVKIIWAIYTKEECYNV